MRDYVMIETNLKRGSVDVIALRAVTVGAVIATQFVLCSSAGADTSTSLDAVQVPMTGVLRVCDFSAKTYVPTVGYGRGAASISAVGSTVSAQVSLLTAVPDTQYTVRLIQEPRPDPARCGATDLAVSSTVLNTDDAGNGAVTVQDQLRPGTTGTWVAIDRPQDYSQIPAEHYTSDFVAPLRGPE